MYEFTKEEQRSIDDAVGEMVHSFSRQERESELRKDIISRMKEEFGLESKTFNTIVKERLNDKVSEQVASPHSPLASHDQPDASRPSGQRN